MDDPVAFAAALAPEIDRLFIAGHRHAAPHARALRAELGLPHFGLLIDVRALLLSPGGMTLAVAAAVNRYSPRDGVRAQLDEHVSQGFLQCADGAYLPTARGTDVLLALTDAMERGLEEIWGGDVHIEEAAELVRPIVEEAPRTVNLGSYPAFAARSKAGWPEARSLSFQVWTGIDALRYFRADAHALAWGEEGMDVTELGVLTALWTGTKVEDASGAYRRLEERGWARLSEGEWTLTKAGREARERIEARTNSLAAPPFLRLSPSDRGHFVTILSNLPG